MVGFLGVRVWVWRPKIVRESHSRWLQWLVSLHFQRPHLKVVAMVDFLAQLLLVHTTRFKDNQQLIGSYNSLPTV